MSYKNGGSFKYNFKTPLDSLFKIIKFNDRDLDTNFGKSCILELSERDLILITDLELPYDDNYLIIEVIFKLEHDITLKGKVIKKYNDEIGKKVYHVELLSDSKSNYDIMKELKNYIDNKQEDGHEDKQEDKQEVELGDKLEEKQVD